MTLREKLYSSGLAWLWITVVVMLIDRWSKMWVSTHLVLYEPLEILPVFNLTLAYNKGAAFNFLHSASGWQNLFLGGLAVVVSAFILYWLFHASSRSRWMSIAMCLVLAGALGNAWDRLLYAHVIDFFDFHLGTWHFAIFNVADSAICVGAAMLFLSWWREAYSKKSIDKNK